MLSLDESIYEDQNIPYVVKGVWATICATGEIQGTTLFVPQYIKSSKDFKLATGYLEWYGQIKGVNDNDDIILN